MKQYTVTYIVNGIKVLVEKVMLTVEQRMALECEQGVVVTAQEDKKMSLDKAIKYGKEKRKPYRGAKAIACGCRNHGSCEYCKENRLHKFKKSALRGLTDET